MNPAAGTASSLDSARRLAAEFWDVVIVGTGMGGATLGYALAQQGRRVLFCERGLWPDASVTRYGAYPEEGLPGHFAEGDDASGRALDTAGRQRDEIVDLSARRPRRFIPFLGAGAGGSSALYGMALERFAPSDFTPRSSHPRARGADLVDEWPVSYAELAPYYAQAEALYRVRGSADPLRGEEPSPARLLPPPPLTVAGSHVFEVLRAGGMHPYRVPLACEALPGCQHCQGVLCPKPCKNDSRRICLEPALSSGNAGLVGGCEALRLQADGRRVKRLVCRVEGEVLTLQARTFVLAAGALQTPRLLLDSRCAEWPDGLANSSGLVGRHLMRHLIDLYALRRPSAVPREAFDNRPKEVAFNDFYGGNGSEKLGSVQSFGRLPPTQMLLAALRRDARDQTARSVEALLAMASPLLARVVDPIVGDSIILASIVEDLPRSSNRVTTAPTAAGPRTAIEYHIEADERRRIAAMRRRMSRLLDGHRYRRLSQAQNNQRLAHACGTCRFGRDPATSVLDPDNRAHDLDNLVVADSSFFPSSGGTNPSLTIAANALRIASRLPD